MIWRKTVHFSTNHGSLIPRVLCAVSEHLCLPTAVCTQLRSEVTPHFLSRFISWPPYPPREFSCALCSVEPFSEEPRLHRLTSLSLRLDSQMFLHSQFRLGGGDPHPCFLTSSPYHSPCLKGAKLQEKTCCTCQNTGLPLMDMHETHCSKTLSAVH